MNSQTAVTVNVITPYTLSHKEKKLSIESLIVIKAKRS